MMLTTKLGLAKLFKLVYAVHLSIIQDCIISILIERQICWERETDRQTEWSPINWFWLIPRWVAGMHSQMHDLLPPRVYISKKMETVEPGHKSRYTNIRCGYSSWSPNCCAKHLPRTKISWCSPQCQTLCQVWETIKKNYTGFYDFQASSSWKSSQDSP